MIDMDDETEDEWEWEATIYSVDGRERNIVARFDRAREAIACLPALLQALGGTLVLETNCPRTSYPIPERCPWIGNELVASQLNFLL